MSRSAGFVAGDGKAGRSEGLAPSHSAEAISIATRFFRFEATRAYVGTGTPTSGVTRKNEAGGGAVENG